jgi:hypothetical protein
MKIFPRKIKFVLDKIKFRFNYNIPIFLLLIILNSLLELLGLGIILPLIDVILSNDATNYQEIIKKIIPDLDIEISKNNLIKFFCFFLISTYLLKFLTKTAYFYFVGKTFQSIKSDLSIYLISFYLKMSYKKFLTEDRSKKIRNITSESQSFAKNYINSIELCSEILLLTGLIILISFINFFIIKITLIFLL